MPKTKREWDPLEVIPTAAVVQQRLEQTQEQARRLRILLKTARQIEREQAQRKQTAANARRLTQEAQRQGLDLHVASDLLAEQERGGGQ